MTKLSEHFDLSEFEHSQAAARRGINNRASLPVQRALANLCAHVLEPVRRHYGKPVIISSGYRSPAVNRAVGGSASSQHCKGEAADIQVPGIANSELARWIARNCDFDQLIREFPVVGDPMSGWVHVSYRIADRRRQVLTAVRRKGALGRLHTEYLPGIL